MWFYWISFSLIHYGFWYLLPLGIVGVATIYALLFWVCGFVKNSFFRAVCIYVVTLVNPFGFNWLDFRVVLVNSPFASDWISLGLIFLGAFLFSQKRIILTIIALLLALNFPQQHSIASPLKIFIANTQIPQELKWQDRNEQVIHVVDEIKRAIDEKYKLILFPESALPLVLNNDKPLLNTLKNYSKQIAIVVGSLHVEDDNLYNSTYFFNDKKVQIAHKFILGPFGEEVPLPSFLKDFINKIFFNSAEDFAKAEAVSDFEIDNFKFRNAICYEATRRELYSDNPQFLLASSNNAWFTPSIQPTLQKMLLRVYGTNHNTYIFHAVNGSDSYEINPVANRALYKIIFEAIF